MIRKKSMHPQRCCAASTSQSRKDASLSNEREDLRAGGNSIFAEGAPPIAESTCCSTRKGQAAEPVMQPSCPARAGQTDLDRCLAVLSEGQWKALQTAFGLILGAAGSFCLFFLGGTITFSSMGLLMAVGVMLVIPNLLQRNLSRSIHLARLVSILSFALLLLAFALLNRPG